MIVVERIEAAERNVDARYAAKHAETAYRRLGPTAAMGERPSTRDRRRFERMLERKMAG
jgi:hypothetical protein